MSSNNFIEQHYARHAEHFQNDLVDAERIKISNSWFDETTADYWRHARAYECVDLLTHRAGSKWLTVGDGRWGLDAIRIRKKGFDKVLPTDISEALLRAGKERGFIDDYAIENAERLTFDNGQFDYVFCKESLHHFPRPYAALYEMFRVAREAVFIIEPNDTCEIVLPGQTSSGVRVSGVRGALRRIAALLRSPVVSQQGETGSIRIKFNDPDWESSGNYVYAISRREIEKIALGLNMPHVVMKGLNDHYIKGVEFEPADDTRSQIFRELKRTVQEKDDLCRRGVADYNLIMAGFFLRPMDEETRIRFSAAGWSVSDLPANPYIAR